MPEGMEWTSIPEGILEDCSQLVKANSIEGNKKNNITIIYTPHANVKNRNRQKQAAMSELHAQSRHRDRGSRVGANKKASRTSNPKLQKRK